MTDKMLDICYCSGHNVSYHTSKLVRDQFIND